MLRPRRRRPAPRPSRHCRLTIRIGGTDYRLRPCPPEAGVLAAWVLRKLDPTVRPLPRRRPQGQARPLHLPGSRTVRLDLQAHQRPHRRRPHPPAQGALLGTRPPSCTPRMPARPSPKPKPSRPKPAATWRRSPPPRRPRSSPRDGSPAALHPSFAAGFRQAVSGPRRPHRPRRLRDLRWLRRGIDAETFRPPGLCFDCAKEGDA